MEPVVSLDHQDPEVIGVNPDLLDLLDLLGQVDPKEKEDLVVSLDNVANQDLQEHLVSEERLDQLDQVDLVDDQDHLDPEDPEERLDQEAKLVLMVDPVRF